MNPVVCLPGIARSIPANFMKTFAKSRIGRRGGHALLFLLALLEATSAQTTTEWVMHRTADGGHPNGLEQQQVWLMNRARANPPAEGLYLTATGDEVTLETIAYFSVDLGRMQREFAGISAQSPAAFDRRLYAASLAHSQYMASINSQTHDGQVDRIKASGFKYAMLRVNIFSYSENSVHAHSAMNIDIGGPASEGGMQAGRGHRMAIMSADPGLPTYSNVGLAMMPESNGATDVGPYVFSGAYAAAIATYPDHYNRFVVGTVWNDRNHNAFYDDGEGLSGVLVQLDHGNWHAVTSAGGGYAIPVDSAGSYRVTFSGGAFPGSFTRQVNVGDISVVADAEVSTVPLTVQPLQMYIQLNAAGGLTLSWTGGRPPYQVQRSPGLAGNWENVGLPTLGLSMALPLTGSAGFFRVISLL